MPRPITRRLLLVQPPGWAPPATTRLVSASQSPPREMPHSSRRPSVRPSQPLPVENSVSAGLPLIAASSFAGFAEAVELIGLCAVAVPAAATSDAQQEAANRTSP